MESEKIFGQHWPLLHGGVSFCWDQTQRLCQCVGGWTVVDRCSCGRLFHRRKEDDEYKGFCGRHKHLKPQCGELAPVWLLYFWLIFISVIILRLSPAASVIWDLVYMLLFACLFVVSVYLYLYICVIIWKTFPETAECI